MAAKYREGKITQLLSKEQTVKIQTETLTPFDVRPLTKTQLDQVGDYVERVYDTNSVRELYTVLMDRFKNAMDLKAISAGVELVLSIATERNQEIERQKPWSLAKDPTQSEQLDAVLYHLAESLRIIAILISPVLPKAAHGIFDQLNWKLDEACKDTRFRLADAVWGGLPDGHVLGKPVPLFPRIEVAA
jgi:methionyl-tRNA synthetase